MLRFRSSDDVLCKYLMMSQAMTESEHPCLTSLVLLIRFLYQDFNPQAN